MNILRLQTWTHTRKKKKKERVLPYVSDKGNPSRRVDDLLTAQNMEEGNEATAEQKLSV